ncbi:MAG: type II toxin-antitoxin system Phd/YefM family antitoxin [bacterium]
MGAVSAGELKKRGVAALLPGLEADGEVVITVRGKDRFVVLTMGKYNEVREGELVRAVRETRADYEAGRVLDRDLGAHMRRLDDEV